MLNFIFGRTGYGKSARLYSMMRDSALHKRRVWLVVPEQEAVNAERAVSALYGDESWIADAEARRDAVRRIEVTTFSRLCDEAARSAGNISGSRLSESAKAALSYRALWEAGRELKTDFFMSESEKNGMPAVDAKTIRSVASLVSALRSECVSPDDVLAAAEKLKADNDGDSDRLFDLAAIYRRFVSSDRLKNDAEGRLAKLISDLEKINVFKDADIYIDRFYTFTGQEYGVIGYMLSANSLTVTVPADGPDSAEEIFAPAIASYKKISSLAAGAGVQTGGVVLCREPVRFRSPELEFLSRSFSTGESYGGEKTDAIVAAECGDPYSEAEYAASRILSHVYSGGRFSDCAVIMRDVEGYSGICDAVFSRHGIPCFMSKRTDAISKPPVKYMMAALMIVSRGFRRDDVVSWLKTGLCGVEDGKISQFVSYINLWELSGRKLYEGAFTMSPDGFDAPADDAGERLSAISETRDRIFAPLLTLRKDMSNAATVSEKCRVLYDFLIASEIPEKLDLMSEEAKADGDAKEASDLSLLWRAICDTLDVLTGTVGDLPVGKALPGTEHFRRLLAAVFSADIGVIPTANDEVVIADAALTRLGEVKHVFVMGAADGSFPRDCDDDPLLPVRDQLLRGGIDLHSSAEEFWQTENYRFYNAVCAASETLTITCPTHGAGGDAQMRSEAFHRICRAFSLDILNGDLLPPEARLFSPDDFIREAAATKDEKLTAALEAAFSKLKNGEELKKRLRAALTSLTAKNCTVPEAAKELFSGDVRLSPSRLEKYIKCRFSYFCDYELKLKEKRPARFRPVDIGNYLHILMERGVSFALSEEYSDEGLKKLLSDVTEEYLGAVCGSGITKMMRASARRISALARFAIEDIRKEFSQSGFRPVAYELAIGGPDGIPAYKIDADGKKVFLSGKIDRLDAAKIGGRTYLRVTDYKTGAVCFNPKKFRELSGGDALPEEQLLDTQLLLYLFAVRDNGGKVLRRIGADGEPALAGILYHPIVPEDAGDDVTFKSKTGLLTNDETVLAAMEKDLCGRFIPIKLNADGTMSRSSQNCVAGEDDFDELKSLTEAAVAETAKNMIEGHAEAIPLKPSNRPKNYSPCQYCKSWAICRCRDGGEEG